MLNLREIEDIVNLRIPEADAREILLKLTPDQVDSETFRSFIRVIEATALPISLNSQDITDCCGTGGSGLSHYNTSTTVSFVLAAGGVRVVKFGNRAMSSKSGSFDFLECLGFPVNIPLDKAQSILDESGLVFLFAPQCYPALRKFNTLRRSLGVRTIFNFMGPILNPARPAYRVLGVSDTKMQAIIADYLAKYTNTNKALVVRGEDGLDELTYQGKTSIYQVESGSVKQYSFESTFNGKLPSLYAELTPENNLKIFESLIQGEERDSVYHKMVCINAGAGFYANGKTLTIEDGAVMAEDLLSNGKVAETVDRARSVYADYLG